MEYLSAGESSSVVLSACDQDSSIGQQGCCVANSRSNHIASKRECTACGMENLCRREGAFTIISAGD
jgi:hypothetical protein